MKKIILMTLMCSLLILANINNTCLLTKGSADDFLPRTTLIEGKVTILNHPELGETPASEMQLTFQKKGCKTCIFGVRADKDGKYQVFVGDGKYKLIVKNPNPVYDLLAPEQKRFVKTENSPIRKIKFDIKLKLPKESG